MPRKRAHDWKTLVERLEKLYASGRTPFGDDEALSDFSNGEPTIFFDEDVWPKLLQWLRDAYAVAERDGPAKVRDEIWRLVQEHTGKTIATLDDLYEGVFSYPLEQRVWNRKDPTDGEGYWSGIDVKYLAQLFMQEMLALARLAAMISPAPAATANGSDLWTVESVAALEGIKPESFRKRILAHRDKHRRLPQWVFLPPGKKRGYLVRYSVYNRHVSPRS